MLKNDTLKNGTSRIGLYGNVPRALERYFVSIICRNYIDNMEIVWGVILFMEILW